MAELTITEIAGAIQGEIVNAPKKTKDIIFKDYHFDSRLIDQENTLFFALKPDPEKREEGRDGHLFVEKLQEKNLKGLAAVVSRDFETKGIDFPLIKVDDTLKAAHSLATYVREKFRQVKYVGVTGSAGKTTTKEFIYRLLCSKYGENKVYRSHMNYNNWIGMPFSLMRLTGKEEVAVFELAMSYPGIGEIDLLAQILRPDIAVILNVFPVHMEFQKNLENVAIGKSEILNYPSPDSAAFITGDSELLLEKTAEKQGQKIYFGKNRETNDIVLVETLRNKEKNTTTIEIEFFGISTQFTCNIISGTHIENLFAAIAVCRHLGMKQFEIQEALSTLTPLTGRGEINQHKDFTIIDETYNANPEAVKKTLDWVNREYTPCKKIAVLGDMLELGEQEMQFHREVGEFFSGLGFDELVTVGQRAAGIAEGAEAAGFVAGKITRCSDAEEAGNYIQKTVDKGCVILFKASRGIRLEKAVKKVYEL